MYTIVFYVMFLFARYSCGLFICMDIKDKTHIAHTRICTFCIARYMILNFEISLKCAIKMNRTSVSTRNAIVIVIKK